MERRRTLETLGGGSPLVGMRAALAATLPALFAAIAVAAEPTFRPDEIEFFEGRIRPLLVTKCLACHGAEIAENGLRLDSRAGVITGGARGAAAVPADPAASLLLRAVAAEDDSLRMPPEGRLSDDDRQALATWIAAGMAWPNEEAEGSTSAGSGWSDERIAEVRDTHWAFRPIAVPPVPEVVDDTWSAHPIDRFLLARMEQAGVKPVADADPTTLVRRLTFDLTGLPPSPAEVEAFAADGAPAALETVIDRLLASPHHGEHVGRKWLDVARYADSSGKDENHAHGNAFRYRDWVVRAINADLPWDRFIVAQIAGDLLPAADEAERHDQLAATGFLQMGQKALAEQDKEKMLLDIADEQLDTVSRGILGLTLSCARCHDHKFDPLRAADYYALAGIFRSTRTMETTAFVSAWLERPLAPEADVEHAARHAARLAAARERLEAARTMLRGGVAGGVVAEAPDAWRSRLGGEDLRWLEAAEDEVADLERTQPAAIPMAMAVSEGDVADLRIHVRGNHLVPGAPAPRGFPPVIRVAEVPPIPPGGSGRLELARWMTRPDHPLTARVIVNRVWQWHFGQGLCRSPDNVGLRGEAPDHPELLDWLTARFMADGWSLKKLHRLILTSRAWRLASTAPASLVEADPDNRLRARFDRRRLTAEELRDALLAVSGRLDPTLGGSVFNYANREPHVTYYKGPVNYDVDRRTLYLPVVRSAMHDLLDLFDTGGALTSRSSRDVTTVPAQALWMLNAPLVLDCAEKLAARFGDAPGIPDAEFVERAWRLAIGRSATPEEHARSMRLLEQASAAPDAPAPRVILSQAILMGNGFVHVE